MTYTTKLTWPEWKQAIWDQMAARFGYPGLAPLEQYTIRSSREKRCVDCGDPCTETDRQVSGLIKCVSHYYLCQDCRDYYLEKNEQEGEAQA